MIEHDHEHFLYSVSRVELPDGGDELLRQCVCGLEERRTFLPGAEHPYRVTFRYQGAWLSPLDVLRLANTLPMEECPDCHGFQPLGPCARCGVLGVLEDGGQLGRPEVVVRHR